MKLSPCTLFCSSVLFLFYTGSAFAEMTKLSKLEAYLKKSGKCYFAVGSGGGDGPILADPDIDPRKIYCVADLAFNEGTINEKSGCSLSFLDANSGAFSQTMNEPIIVEGKTCSGGGFEKLLEKTYLSGYVASGPKMGNAEYTSVKTRLFEGPYYSPHQSTKAYVLYSQNASVRNIYNNAVKNFSAEKQAAALAEEKGKKEAALVANAKQKAEKEHATKRESERLSNIEGKWFKDCQLEDGRMSSMLFELKAGHFTLSIIYFGDDACSEKTGTMKMYGTYKLTSKVDAKNGVISADLIRRRATLTPMTEEAASQLTSQSSYGILAWSAGVEQDISSTEGLKVTMNKTRYKSYKLDGQRLYESTVGEPQIYDPNSRKATKFDMTNPWKRK